MLQGLCNKTSPTTNQNSPLLFSPGVTSGLGSTELNSNLYLHSRNGTLYYPHNVLTTPETI